MHSGTKFTFSVITVFLIVWLALRYLLPLFSPFLLGTGLALAAEPMVGFLNRHTRLPRSVCSGVGVTAAFALIALAVLLLCAFLVRELGLLAGVLPDLESTTRTGISLLQGRLLDLASHTPAGIRPMLEKNVNTFFSNGAALVDQAVRYLLGLAGSLLSHVPDSALGLGTGMISAYLISAKLPRIRQRIRSRLPREKLKGLAAAGKRMKKAVAGWLVAQCKLMMVTFAIVSLGLMLLRIPYAPLWAGGVALVDAFPVLGSGTVLLPWALICLLQGNTPQALGLLGLYIAVTLVRSMLEPRLVGRHIGLDPLLTLAALYAGYQLWGIGGMILAPLLAVAASQIGSQPGSRE